MFYRLSEQSRAGNMRAAAAQASILASAAAAFSLGEVLLDTPTAIAVGLALGQTLPGAPVEDVGDG